MAFREVLDRVLSARLAYPVIVAALLGAVAVNEWTHQRAGALMQGGGELMQMRLQAMEALQRLTDAESAQRGYMITGRAEYLRPYEAALVELPHMLEPTLAFLARTGGAAGADADSARELIGAKLAEMRTTVELHRAGKTAEALGVVESDIGQAGMDQIRARLGRAFEVAAQQRDAGQRSIARALELRRWAVHGLALLAALALVGYLQRMWAQAQARESGRELLEQEVQARTRDLRALAAHLQTMQEDERARLARELHDELGGLLTAAKLDLSRAGRATDLAQVAERIAQVGRRIDEVVSVKRRIIEDLRPSALEHLGLAKALGVLCREVGQRLGVAVATRIDDVALDPEAQITVYRLVQEALTNVQKYAQAQRIEVEMRARGAAIEVAVEDDGRGFDAEDVRVGRQGLAGMRHRVEALGGRLDVRSAPGQGTRIAATLPLAPAVA